jgi:hypothetical protein
MTREDGLAKARAVRAANTAERKKGNASWQPAKKLELYKKKDGFRYRWCDKDPYNVMKKEAEGWVHATAETGLKPEHDRVETVSDGKPLDTVTEYRELTLMALPEDLALARDAYIAAETDKQTVGRVADLRQKVADAAPAGMLPAAVHQKVVIE